MVKVIHLRYNEGLHSNLYSLRTHQNVKAKINSIKILKIHTVAAGDTVENYIIMFCNYVNYQQLIPYRNNNKNNNGTISFIL